METYTSLYMYKKKVTRPKRQQCKVEEEESLLFACPVCVIVMVKGKARLKFFGCSHVSLFWNELLIFSFPCNNNNNPMLCMEEEAMALCVTFLVSHPNFILKQQQL